MSDFERDERLDRIEQHLKSLKVNDELQGGVLKSIQSALIGDNLNGNKGLVYLVDDIDKRLNNLEQRQAITDENMRNLKWITRAVGSSIIAFFLWFFTKKA